ncbi:MAG: xanthine dehydrogenase family protein molybdopterin-binding subunit [Candidatus Eremiobacteraeota bacterium]|nr:xanthine dehydrogenase family protein molybdopterin-binding subunit [Candidatus Eremiobacteraeota bacterium]
MTAVVGRAVVGTPTSRLDGREKVSGEARYAADWPFENPLYGVLVQSSIPSGRIDSFDLAAAESAPGVARIFTHLNAPRLVPMDSPPLGQTFLPLQSDRIDYEGQHVALVIAETLEQAQHAARLVRVVYERGPARIDFRAHLTDEIEVQGFFPADTSTGDVSAGLGGADVKIDVTYRTADRHHVPIEPSATLADWRDGKLTLYDAAQWVHGVRIAVAHVLGIPLDDVRVISKFVGGGFGCKGFVWPHQILAAMASRELGRPVKLVLSRAHTFTAHGYQTASEQRVVLGATRDGRFVAIRHHSWTPTAISDDYLETCATPARASYASGAIETRNRAVRVNRGVPTPMRAPHEGVGAVAFECALDELAYALGVDPLEMRLRNYAERDPTTGTPFSQKNLRECYRIGAERFGWARRSPVPGTMRDGDTLIGYGMAGAVMFTVRMPSTARITLHPGGDVVIETATQDIGGGQYTILPMIAADALGVPVERVRIVLGDTALPDAGGTFGSSSTMSAGSAVFTAAQELKRLLGGRRSVSQPLTAEGKFQPEHSDALSMFTFGAVFAEVHVDRDLPTPRVARITGVYSAGRIINPKTARSQIIGGMTWGIGQALLEASELDLGLGRYLSKNLAGYVVPACADVRELDVTFIEEVDEHASLLGAKGIGELGAVGVAAAIGNAIYHATGTRVRDFPIRPERLL